MFEVVQIKSISSPSISAAFITESVAPDKELLSCSASTNIFVILPSPHFLIFRQEHQRFQL